VLPVKRFHWDSAEYAEAFATLVRCYGVRVYECQILREIFSAYPAESHAVDWGAGGEDLTSLLVEHFHHVYAVEPHPGMRAVLATRCPLAQVADGTIMSTVLPTNTIARFMLCDRDADAFSRPPTEEAFQAYVRKHFWDERTGRGGWEYATHSAACGAMPCMQSRPGARE
jgi:hypothetical protein